MGATMLSRRLLLAAAAAALSEGLATASAEDIKEVRSDFRRPGSFPP